MKAKCFAIDCARLLTWVIALLVASKFWMSVQGAERRYAQVEMHCLSIHVSRSETVQFDQEYNLFLRADPDPKVIGELRPATVTENPTSLSGYYRLVGPDYIDQTGEFVLDLPPFADANTNGIDDFFEVTIPLAAVQSGGSFYDPRGGPTKIIATWTRPANSALGNVEFQMASRALHLTITFQVQFRILVRTGSLSYTPGRNDAVMQMEELPGPGVDLSGTVRFAQGPQGAVTMPGFKLMSPPGTPLESASDPMLTMTGNRFSGLVQFFDGDPWQTQEFDYTLWKLTVFDPRLAEAVSPAPPRLQITKSQSDAGFVLVITGEPNRNYALERKGEIGSGWVRISTVSTLSGVETIHLDPDRSGSAFYRVTVIY